jgi:hypothetical protein
MVDDANFLKEGIEFLILMPPICLHSNNLPIKLVLNILLIIQECLITSE